MHLTLHSKKLFLLLWFSAIFITSNSQTAISKIYTDFGGFWTTDSTHRNPNTSHNLLAYRVGTAPNDTIFSTGINDALLTAKGINYTASNFRALPVRLGNLATISTTSYYIGIGSRSNNTWQPPTSPSPYVLPFYQTPDHYLKDGDQGLDLGTALFNIPVAGDGVSYQIDQFNPSRIGDKIPDIVVTQMGDFSGTADKFKFVDANGNTVGRELSSNFPGSLGISHWSFYTAFTGRYPSGQPGSPVDNNRNPRDIRVIQWDLSAFGLNTNNVGNVVRFVHVLGGSSDPAFIAYNTSSFRALSEFTAGCQITSPIPVWLQANRGINATSNLLTSWKNDGNNGFNAEQSNNNNKPLYVATSETTNYRPYVSFTPGKILAQSSTPFSNNTTGNFEAFVVARPVSNTGAHKIVGFKRSGSGVADSASLWLNASGALEFRSNSSTILLTGGTPGINSTGIWRINYSNTGTVSIALNGGTAVSASIPNLSPLPHWHTEYGNSSSSFDLAEIMYFSGSLSPTERQRIQSYLSVKYGIHYTTNYMAGTGDIIWNQENGGYNSRIFGIGREDCQGMSQKQSHSVTAGTQDIIRIGLNNIAASNAANTGNIPDAHYIIWGDNNAPLTAVENIRSVQHCLLAPQRKWRVQTTGNLANSLPTQVVINTADITWNNRSTAAGDYFLLIDRNGNGIYNDPQDAAIPAAAINGTNLTFNNVLWDTDNSESDLFTIGLRQATPDAGPDQTQAGNTFTMNATPTSGSWSIVSRQPANAAITVNNISSYNTQITVANGTTAILRWTPSTPGAYCYDDVNLTNTVPLPVGMIAFTANVADKYIGLVWNTAWEENNEGFYIEHSTDGTHYITAGFVAGKNEAASYHFLHTTPVTGNNFYRLKQVDYDGKYSYSSVQKVDHSNNKAIYISPNPVTDILTIHYLPLQSPIVIFTTEGKLLYKGLYQPLSVSDWKPGVYLVKVNYLNQSQTLRFIKL